ncbi:DUF6187 family protein [Streptomyces sp. ODS05-4]|uniref:DUF6187 family protein n=1 Tax=Streptomyces sp. ODS05-4 TaxID=2944939 RepID=UPI0027E59791|nr:DUF6187 family protein [Streptomyces sp. ODS05-4]
MSDLDPRTARTPEGSGESARTPDGGGESARTPDEGGESARTPEGGGELARTPDRGGKSARTRDGSGGEHGAGMPVAADVPGAVGAAHGPQASYGPRGSHGSRASHDPQTPHGPQTPHRRQTPHGPHTPHGPRASETAGDDPRFALTPVDEPAMTETGVMLMGLEAERLLAGLGLATLADDPAQVLLAVDRVRHGVRATMTFEALVGAGARRWREARPVLAATGGAAAAPVALRRAWDETLRLFAHCDLGAPGPATTAHLAACWLRRDEIDRFTQRTVHGEATAR